MRFVAIFIILFLSACSATGPYFKPAIAPPTDRALVYIYRPDSHALSARTALISMDDNTLAELNNKGYVSLYINPGQHKFSLSWAKWLGDNSNLQNPIFIVSDIKANEPNYIRISSDWSQRSTTVHVGWSFTNVPASIAEKEIARCRLQD